MARAESYTGDMPHLTLIDTNTEAVCFYFIFFDLGFTVRQDYFTHFEPNQSFGGAKKHPRKNT